MPCDFLSCGCPECAVSRATMGTAPSSHRGRCVWTDRRDGKESGEGRGWRARRWSQREEERGRDRETDRNMYTDRQAERTVKQTKRQKDGRTDRKGGKQTKRQKDRRTDRFQLKAKMPTD